MTNRADKLPLIDGLLNILLAERPASIEEQQDYDALVSALMRVRRRTQASTPNRNAEAPVELLATITPGSYEGLLLGDAVAKCLASRKKLFTRKEIYAILYTAGYEFASKENPLRTIPSTLKRRAVVDGDVFQVSSTLWGHKEQFTPDEIAELRNKHAGTGGKSAYEHGRETSAGMAAARERGVRFGPDPKFPRDEAERLIKEGVSITRIAQRYGVTNAALYRYYKRDDVRRLRDEGRQEREATQKGNETADDPDRTKSVH